MLRDDETGDRDGKGRARTGVSVAILAAVACVPIVVAAGFIVDHLAPSAVPGDISVLALRGVIDGDAAHRPPAPARAGF